MSCGKYFRVKWGNRTIAAYNYFKRLRKELRETIIRIVAKRVLCHQSEVWSHGVCRAALLQSWGHRWKGWQWTLCHSGTWCKRSILEEPNLPNIPQYFKFFHTILGLLSRCFESMLFEISIISFLKIVLIHEDSVFSSYTLLHPPLLCFVCRPFPQASVCLCLCVD